MFIETLKRLFLEDSAEFIEWWENSWNPTNLKFRRLLEDVNSKFPNFLCLINKRWRLIRIGSVIGPRRNKLLMSLN